MKTQNRNIYLILAVFFSLLSSCDDYYHDCIRGNGPTIRDERNVDDFDEIYNVINANVHITQGEPFQVIVEGREDIVDKIRTRVNNDELSIESRYCLKGGGVDIFITMPEITRISNAGSGNIYSDNVWITQDLDMSVSGSGDINADLEADNLDYKIAGSGNITLTGNCVVQEIRISGSGRVNSFGLFSDEADVNISGSGRCEINVDEILDVRISGSGRVYYKGNPTIDSSISGSGRIIDAN